MKKESKISIGDAAEKESHRMLSRIINPASFAFINKAPIPKGSSGLHLNCGTGKITAQLATLIQPQGSMLGLDADADKIKQAIFKAVELRDLNIQYATIKEYDHQNSPHFQFAYSRFLYSRFANHQKSVYFLSQQLKAGGMLLLEDLDLRLLNCFPYSFAFDRFLELMIKLNACGQEESNLGKRIKNSLEEAGFQSIQIQFLSPTFLSGSAKRLPSLTLEGQSEKLLNQNIITHSELHALLAELRAFEIQPHSMISLPGIYQIQAYRS